MINVETYILASVSGSGVTVTNVFDGFMRVVQEHTLDAGPARSVAYTWNPVGTVASATGPAGTSTYGYDPAERLTNLVAESGSFAWTYHPDNGLAASMAHAQSGIDAAYGFDITDRLTGIAWSGTIPAMSFSMEYSTADMITNVVHASGEKRVYTYDSLDRLTGEKHYDASQTLTHKDPNGVRSPQSSWPAEGGRCGSNTVRVRWRRSPARRVASL